MTAQAFLVPQHEPAELQIDVVVRSEGWNEIAVGAALQSAALAAFTAATERRGAYEVALVLTDDKDMQALNRDWRGKDMPTNVLSFPAGRSAAESGTHPLGDVVLALETVTREADALGIPTQHHAQHLTVHGMLHLLGLDHDTEQDATRMESLESQVMVSLGVADPYADLEREAPEAGQ